MRLLMTEKQRKIELEGTFNTRDLGGYPVQQGGQVVWGRLFRSDDLHLLTDDDQQHLAEMGINLIIDYRNKNEREKRPNKEVKNAQVVVLEPDDPIAAIASADIKTDQSKIDALIQMEAQGKLDVDKDQLLESILGYVNNERSQKVYAEMLKLIVSTPDCRVIQHCRGGKDRTGYGTALILLVLGVDEETIVYDYLLTNQYNQERNNKRLQEYKAYTSNQAVLDYLASAMGTREEVIRAALAEMKRKSGTPLAYIQEYLGISDELIAQFRERFVVDDTN